MTIRCWISHFSFLVIFVIPSLVHAQVVISEVMYNLAQGSDMGREWVEVFNSGINTIDLTTWKLFEAETSHKIASSGSATIPGGAYAIVAADAVKFLTDHPSYSGLLFDSAFSLSNVGETIILRDATLADRDSFTYSKSMGATGDGNSLHRTVNTIMPGVPSPGSGIFVTNAPKKPEEKTATSPKISVQKTAFALEKKTAEQAERTPKMASSELLTAVATSAPYAENKTSQKGVINTWTLGFIALLVIGGAGAFFTAHSRRETWDIEEI